MYFAHWKRIKFKNNNITSVTAKIVCYFRFSVKPFARAYKAKDLAAELQ